MHVPPETAEAVRMLVYKEANQHGYLTRSKNENRAFLSMLVAKESVGGRLAEFMPRERVRTYIKDAILNRYAKDSIQDARLDDFSVPIRERMGVNSVFVERDKKGVSLYKSRRGSKYVVVAEGTYMKWETALRKGLVYIASKPFSRRSGVKVYLLLALYARKQRVPPADAEVLRRALRRCKCAIFIYGER